MLSPINYGYFNNINCAYPMYPLLFKGTANTIPNFSSNSSYTNNPVQNNISYKDSTISAADKIKNLKQDKQDSSVGKTLLIGTGIATLAGIGLWIASRGKVKPKALTDVQAKKLEELVSSGKIDKNYAELFKDMNGLEIDQWLGRSYDKMCSDLGYKFAYDTPNIKISTDFANGGSMDLKTITLYMQGGKTSETDVLATMRHELEHFRQKDLVYRAFGEEEFLNAEIQPMLRKLKNNPAHCLEQTGKKYGELSKVDIDKYIQRHKDMLRKDCVKLRSLQSRKGSIEKGSELYDEAKKYYEAMKNYETPSMYEENFCVDTINKLKKTNPERIKFLQEIFKKYQNNDLEIGAVHEGDKIRKMHELFLKEVSEA